VPERDGVRLLLLDVTQAVGRVPFSFAWSGAEIAVLSAHKLGGPKGVGALIVRDGVEIPPLAVGGGQEMGRRSGTENVIGIAGSVRRSGRRCGISRKAVGTRSRNLEIF
jgi:cysteine desulfurase